MPKAGRLRPGPISGRPYMPGYGMMFDKKRKSLPWTWAVDRLTDSHTYWLISTRLDGRPHAMPIWGVWVRNCFFFSTGVKSRKSKNLQKNPKCIVCPEGAADAVVLEGTAEVCSDKALLRECTQSYKKKYQWDLKGTEDPIYRVVPRVVFGISENLSRVKGNPTRWTLPESSRYSS